MKLNYILMPLVLILVVTVSCDNEINLVPETVQKKEQLNYVAGELLIKFRDGDKSASKTKSTALSLIKGSVVETINTNAMKSTNTRKGISAGELVLVSSKLGTMEAIAALKNAPEIEYAEPNWIYHHFATSDDPFYTNGSLWGMGGNQYGSQAAGAWATGHTGSSTVYVGIIDEGYMYTHEDLSLNVGMNPGETPNNGADDDNNGLVDDVYGWDFVNNNNTIFDGVDDDHGTHVAGTIGARGGNKIGVAGVVWNVKILNAKFLGTNGGTTANAIKAVDYFTTLKTRINQPVNIVATNNSWGGGGYSTGLYQAIERANVADILFIAAAGNATTNIDTSPSYPASYDNANIIAVASITNSGAISSFSNYGEKSADIGAAGSGIYSTIPKRSKGTVVSAYASYSGTSMATPHVTGACALYASTYNLTARTAANAATIKAAILGDTQATSSLNGKCVSGGRLNVSGF
jgi:subtilisin family serine protease